MKMLTSQLYENIDRNINKTSISINISEKNYKNADFITNKRLTLSKLKNYWY